MVINDRYQFVFLHIPKVGGNSIKNVLNSLDGNNDRWISPHTKHETLGDFLSHWQARRDQEDLRQERMPDEYRSFGFVRNPWDRMSSLYRYLVEKRPREEIDRVASLSEFLERAIDGEAWIDSLHSMRPQVEFLQVEHVQHPVARPVIGAYENLNQDVQRIFKELRLPPIELPHHNRSSNSSHDYRTEYTSCMIDNVRQLFAQDVETFGYEFDSPEPKSAHR